jgi:Transposase DDE domain
LEGDAHKINGYEAHISVEAEEGFILGGHVTPAHVADTTRFEKLLTESALPEGSFAVADKGYCSEKNRTLIHNTYTDGIVYKARWLTGNKQSPIVTGNSTSGKTLVNRENKPQPVV